MKLYDMKCPNCDAILKIKPGAKKYTCEFCDSIFIIEDDELQSDEQDDIENQYENNHSHSERDDDYRRYKGYDPSSFTSTSNTERRTWLWVLGWIFCFPIPASILIMRKKDWNILLRILLIYFLILLYFRMMMNSPSSSSDSGNYSKYSSYEDSKSFSQIYKYNNRKPDRDGFDDDPKLHFAFGGFSTTVPGYFGDVNKSNSTEKTKYFYETTSNGTKIMLMISYDKDVAFTESSFKNSKDKYIEGFLGTIDDSSLVSSFIPDQSDIPEFEFVFSGKPKSIKINGYAAVFLNPVNGHIFSLMLVEPVNSYQSYSSDFSKIVNSVKLMRK